MLVYVVNYKTHSFATGVAYVKEMVKKIICHNDEGSLICGSGQVLDISEANYGGYLSFSW